MRNGFTLIELLVVVGIIAIIVVLLAGVFGGILGVGSKTFEAEVTDKWTDIDYDNNKMYRVRTMTPSGEIDTWNSYWCHDDVQIGISYQFQAVGGSLSKASRLALQPVRITAESESQ